MRQISNNMKTAFSGHINMVSVGKGVAVSYLITIPMFVIFALALTYTNFPEKLITPAVVITTIVSVLFAGSTVTKNISSRGWLNGGFVGLIYMLALYFVSSIAFNNYDIDKYVITMGFIGILTGSIGGILGVNLKKGPHNKMRR